MTSSTTPADYHLTIEIPARFADLDVNMHLNNVAASTFYEQARVEMHRKSLAKWLGAAENRSFLLVGRTTIEYWTEGPYPATYTIGVGVSKISTSSFVDSLALFVRGHCIGACDTVMVHSHGGGSASPIPADMREALEGAHSPSALRF